MMTRDSEIPFILCVPWENRNLVCLVVVFQPHSYSQLKAPCLETIKALQPQGTKDHQTRPNNRAPAGTGEAQIIAMPPLFRKVYELPVPNQ